MKHTLEMVGQVVWIIGGAFWVVPRGPQLGGASQAGARVKAFIASCQADVAEHARIANEMLRQMGAAVEEHKKRTLPS